MLTFPLSPGVFVDEPEFVSFSASRADTAVPAFVTGPAAEQPWWAAAGQPVIIRSFAEYEQAVRGPVRSRRGLAGSRYLPGSPALRPGRGPARWPTLVAASGAEAGTDIDWSRPLAPALKAFFGNGGGWCYLCPRDKLAAVADLPDVTLVVQAGEAGTEGDILALCQPGSGLFALLDGPQHEGMFSAGALEAHLATLSPSESAALYYPWLRASWPVRDGSGQRVEDIHLVSPGAVAAGLLCQTDRVTGPWKAPSNLPVSAGLTPVVRVGDNAQARFTSMDFTAMSVNMFRSFSVPGVRLWGARALTAGGSAWGYIQVRRTFDMVERDLQRALAAALFEPNGPETWRLLRATADNYLHTLMQQGAFAGSTAAECYRVEAGLGVTMSEADVRAGTLRMRIGLAVVRPAEFVVLEFSQQRDADDGAGGLPVVVPVTLTSPAKGASFNTEYIPTYSGRGTYKATVTIEQRATGAHSWDTVGTAKVDRNGNWSLAGGTLSAGEREARASQSSDDSVSESNTFTVTQAVTLTSPAKGASFDITHAPTYRGRGAPGATVTIEQRTTADLSWDTVGTATVDSEGNWSLAGGTLSASEREARASQSSDASVSESNTFTVTQAVTLTSPAKGESFDITHALTYRGRGAPGATVTIHQGLISSSWSTMGTATVASDGNWSLAGGTLGAGKREAKASQSSDGSSSKSNTFTVTQAVTLTSPAKGASFNTEHAPTYSGRGAPGATVTIQQKTTADPSWNTVGTKTVDRDGNWSLAGGTLSAGEREARASQSSDGSVSESNTFTVTQAVTLTSPAKGASFDITHAPTYRGRGAPGATVTIQQKTTADPSWNTVGTATVDSEGNWSLAGGTLSASEREARASQSSDASVSESNTFTVTQAVTLTSPAKGESFDITHALTYRGRGAPGATVTIHQGLISSSWSTMGTATVASDGNWSLAGGTLGAGKREAKASQSSDGSSSKSNTFTVTQAVTLTSPAKGASFNTEHAPTYSGRGAPGATVTIQQKTTADPSWNTVGTKTVDRDGNWSLAGGTLSAGEREARASQSSDGSVSESNTFTVTQAVREYVRAEQQLPAFTTGMLNKMGGSLAMDHDGRALAVSGDRSSKSEVCVYQKSGAIWSEFKRDNVSPGYEGRVLVMDSTGENFAVGIPVRGRGTTALYNASSSKPRDFCKGTRPQDNGAVNFGDGMGTSLAINSAGTLVASGAVSGEESGKKGGSVVMFHQINGEWAVPDIDEVIHLGVAAAENDRFGSALAMNGAGSLLVVSAPGRRDGKGEVITFTWQNDSWQRSDEPAPGDATLFGTRLSMNEAGTLLAVSGTTANDDGAVYLFSRQQDGWQLVQTITLPAETAPGFGYDVALSGDGGTLCVSSPTATNAESAVTGCVWIYKNPASEWQLMQQLFAPDAAAGHRYGEAIAVNHAGTLLAVGVPGAPGTTAGETGKVWLYEEQIT